jgi:hypothetical protein
MLLLKLEAGGVGSLKKTLDSRFRGNDRKRKGDAGGSMLEAVKKPKPS